MKKQYKEERIRKREDSGGMCVFQNKWYVEEGEVLCTEFGNAN